jgi:hypothetical protein
MDPTARSIRMSFLGKTGKAGDYKALVILQYVCLVRVQIKAWIYQPG